MEEKIDLYINWRKNELNNTIKKIIELAKKL